MQYTFKGQMKQCFETQIKIKQRLNKQKIRP